MYGRYYIESEDTDMELRAIIEEARQKVSGKDIPLKTAKYFHPNIVPAIAKMRILNSALSPCNGVSLV